MQVHVSRDREKIVDIGFKTLLCFLQGALVGVELKRFAWL